jgi:chromosome segregation ATPase
LLKPLSVEEKNKLQKIENLQENIAGNKKKIELFDNRIAGLNENLSSFSKNLPSVFSILGMQNMEVEYSENNLSVLKDNLTELEKRINCMVEIHGLIQSHKVIFFFEWLIFSV